MIKKLTIIFAVLTAVCVLAIIPLTPFAVRDLADMIVPRYNQLKSIQPIEVFPLDDSITTLSLDSMVGRLRFTHNENREIVVKSSQLSKGDLSVESSVQGDTVGISLTMKYNSINLFSMMDSASDIWDSIIRLCADSTDVEISIPDGLILVDRDGRNLLDNNSQNGYRYNDYIVDRDVQYFRVEDVIDAGDSMSSPKPVSSFDARVKLLRNDLLQLVRTNAEGDYTQLEFNMNLNDCRIRLESLLLEYAKDQGLINYDKYKEQETASSKRIGLSARLNVPPEDNSVDEAEAKAVIRDLSGLYLSRLVAQAKLDVILQDRRDEDADYMETKENLEQQIGEYTEQIKELEEKHLDFVTGLMATGLLF